MLQMPREAFSEHMGLRGASGQKTGGWARQGDGAQAKEQHVGLIHSPQKYFTEPYSVPGIQLQGHRVNACVILLGSGEVSCTGFEPFHVPTSTM